MNLSHIQSDLGLTERQAKRHLEGRRKVQEHAGTERRIKRRRECTDDVWRSGEGGMK